MLHPAAKARAVLAFYRDFIATAPDELTTIVVLRMGAARALPSSVGARATGRRHRGDALIDTLAERAWRVVTPESYTIIFHLGGAVGRQDPEGSAFEDRREAHAVNIDAVWSEPARASACVAWTRELWEAVRPYSTGRVYVNFLGEEGQERVRAAYGEAKYERLRALKRTYDPTNFFRLNQNIRP
jgi:hypothetical protein